MSILCCLSLFGLLLSAKAVPGGILALDYANIRFSVTLFGKGTLRLDYGGLGLIL